MKIQRVPKIAALDRATAVLLLLISCGAGLRAAEWKAEIVEPGGGGKYSSLKIDRAGNAHVAFYDEINHELKYGFRDAKLQKWFATKLDGSSGFCSLALDSKDRPHISYLLGNGKLGYIHWDGKAWIKEPLAINAKVIDFYTSIALDSNDHPTISFYEYWGMGEDYELHLREITRTNGRWELRTIDSAAGSGKFNSVAIGPSGLPQIAYANVRDENASLRYAAWDGKSWTVTILEGALVRRPIQCVALALDKKGAPRIVYSDLVTNEVKYAALENGKWMIQPVDLLMGAAYPDRNGIAIDENGNPYLSYFDAAGGTLKLAYQVNGKWMVEKIDQSSGGFTSSLQISGGYIWMTYSDATGTNLQFVFRKLQNSPATLTSERAKSGQ